MSQSYDFERAWLAKLSGCLDDAAGEAVRREIMAGSESLSAQSSSQEVVDWSRQAMERLQSRLDPATQRRVMTGCACRYPTAELQAAREAYAASGDVGQVHRMLQAKFVAFLRAGLGLEEELVEEIVDRGWGLAGVLEGDRIVATKIPKSGYLVEYMQESDPQKRRALYCHCPRIRDVLETGETLPAVYCYCGAGYYQGIWEDILGVPVEVEVLESVLLGDDVCKIAVHLP